MRCNVCGAQVQDGSTSCPVCGANLNSNNVMDQQPMMNQGYPMYQQPMMNQGYPMDQQPMMNQGYAIGQQPMMNQGYAMGQQPMMNQGYKQPMSPEKKKKMLIIGGICAAVAILAIILVVVIKNNSGTKNTKIRTECDDCGEKEKCLLYKVTEDGESEYYYLCDDCYEDWEEEAEDYDYKIKEASAKEKKQYDKEGSKQKTTNCEMCGSKTKCYKYEITYEGETESGYLCDDCADSMKAMIQIAGGTMKKK